MNRMTCSLSKGLAAWILSQDNTWNISSDLTKIAGRHTFKFGAQFMNIGHSYYATNTASGYFTFNSGYTASSPLSGTGGYSMASYLLGYPASGSAAEPAYPNGQERYRAIYFGDTWQVTKRLTLNLGLRYEQDGPWSERYNRLTFWDLSAPNALAQQTGLPLQGEVGFVNSGLRASRNAWNLNELQFAPRFGFAYQIDKATVLRGGYGIFWIPELAVGGALQPSSDPANSAGTTFVSSLNGGITPVGSLNNPFPSGLQEPLNPSVGNAALNQAIESRGGGTDATPNVRNGYMQQWNFDIQRQLPAGFFVDAAYAAAKGTHLGYTQTMNQLPDSLLALGSALLTQVRNPFYGYIQSGPLSSATVAASQLLLPYPQYSTVNVSGTGYGTSSYQSLQLKVEKHLEQGGTLLVSYTFAKLLADADTALCQTETGYGRCRRRRRLEQHPRFLFSGQPGCLTAAGNQLHRRSSVRFRPKILQRKSWVRDQARLRLGLKRHFDFPAWLPVEVHNVRQPDEFERRWFTTQCNFGLQLRTFRQRRSAAIGMVQYFLLYSARCVYFWRRVPYRPDAADAGN